MRAVVYLAVAAASATRLMPTLVPSPYGAAAALGEHADSEAALRRTRRLFINRDNLRAAIRTIVNETLRVREVALWGLGTSCASDSHDSGRGRRT